jgi:hypothetical protein
LNIAIIGESLCTVGFAPAHLVQQSNMAQEELRDLQLQMNAVTDEVKLLHMYEIDYQHLQFIVMTNTP